MQFTKVSWEELEKHCLSLSQKVKTVEFERIISISRGGDVIARILSDLLGKPITHISIQSYQGLLQKELQVTQELPGGFSAQKVLLVDEISDHGTTFLFATKYLQEKGIEKIYTLAPFVKSHTKHLPDFWEVQNDNWMIFPYEIRETCTSFVELFKTREEAIKKMKEIGFQEWELGSL